MSESQLLEKLEKAIIDFDEDIANEIGKSVLEKNLDVEKALASISSALEEVGRRYEAHEYFMADLMLAGDTAKNVINLLEAKIDASVGKFIGRVVFGTVKGDIHDIGKTIISSFLIGAGFIVKDIGVEASSAKFVESIKKHKPDIVAISALLSNTAPYMVDIIKTIERTGLRNSVKIIVGGRPVTEEFAKKIGADGTADNPSDVINICKTWMDEKLEKA